MKESKLDPNLYAALFTWYSSVDNLAEKVRTSRT